MKVVNLPPSYLQDQIQENLLSYLSRNVSDYKEKVVLLPRTLSVLSKTILLGRETGEAGFSGNFNFDAFLSKNLLAE